MKTKAEMDVLNKTELLLKNGFEIEGESDSTITLSNCFRVDRDNELKEGFFFVHMSITLFKKDDTAYAEINSNGKIYDSKIYQEISDALNEVIDLMNVDLNLLNRAFGMICSKRLDLFPKEVEEK